MLTTHRRNVTQGLRVKGSMRAIVRLKQAPMPMADKDAKNVPATVMAVTVARVATVRNGVSAASARTVRRLTTSSRWKALALIPEARIHCQPP